jgi:tetratricopeptide (TPR) repeat protein
MTHPGFCLQRIARRAGLVIALIAVLALLAPGSAAAEFLRLADGSVLQVRVLETDETGVKILRMDNGGTVRFTWEQLGSEDRTRLRQEAGLELPDFDKLLQETGDRVELYSGEVLEGNIVSETDTAVKVRTIDPMDGSDDIETVAVDKIRQIFRDVKIPANKLYPPDELYERVQAENPPVEAKDYYLLALYCRQFNMFEEGVNNIDRALELKPEFEERLAPLREELVALANERELSAQIHSAEKLIKRREFGGAEILLKAIIEDSETPEAIKSAAEKVMRRLDTEAAEVIGREWMKLIPRIAAIKAREDELNRGAARGYAVGQMQQDILAALQEEFELEPERLTALFELRDRSSARGLSVKVYLDALRERPRGTTANNDDDNSNDPRNQLMEFLRSSPEAQDLYRKIQGAIAAGDTEEMQKLRGELEDLYRKWQADQGNSRSVDPAARLLPLGDVAPDYLDPFAQFAPRNPNNNGRNNNGRNTNNNGRNSNNKQ